MREIITIQIGQCGNAIGHSFWKQLCNEHKIDQEGKKTASDKSKLVDNIFFREKEKKEQIYVPRVLCVDTNTEITSKLSIFPEENIIVGSRGAGNNWAKGFYTEGAEIVDYMLDKLRKEVEKSESCQGFQLIHGLGGGTGSGLGSLISLKLREEFPALFIATHSIVPSPKVDCIVEPYNGILTFQHLIENADLCFLYDMESLYEIAFRKLKQSQPSYKNLNYIIEKAIVPLSLSWRTKNPESLRSMATNLVPLPRVHFIQTSAAPLGVQNDIIKSVLTFDNSLVESNKEGVLLSSILNVRTSSNQEILEERIEDEKKHAKIVDWIPENFNYRFFDTAPNDPNDSAVLLSNSTRIMPMFDRLSGQFNTLLKRRAFIHWYLQEGMGIEEFEEARDNVEDLMFEILHLEDEWNGNEIESLRKYVMKLHGEPWFSKIMKWEIFQKPNSNELNYLDFEIKKKIWLLKQPRPTNFIQLLPKEIVSHMLTFVNH